MQHPEDLLAAIARQAIRDYRAGYTCRRHMDAGEWLDRAGLLTSDGQIDPRGCGDVSTPQPMGEPLKYWRCKTCATRMGLIVNGKLIIGGGWQIIEGTIVCRSCGRTRRWAPVDAQPEQRRAG